MKKRRGAAAGYDGYGFLVFGIGNWGGRCGGDSADYIWDHADALETEPGENQGVTRVQTYDISKKGKDE